MQQQPSTRTALEAAKRRWAAAQRSHALRGTPAREMQEREKKQQQVATTSAAPHV